MVETSTYLAPTWTHRVFRRTRLTTQLDHVTARAITLICAPPGTGKTMLVADWVRSRPDLLTAWLDADPLHNDRDVLCRELTRRFSALGLLASPGGIITDPVDALLARLSRSRPPAAEVVCVIDDAHEITERRAWQAISRLTASSPDWLRWVIVTRVDPPFGIQRLLLPGRLAQVRSVDLAFDLDETVAVLSWFGLAIPVDAANDLLTWSEGWAAALCLAARAMIGQDLESRPWERLQESESVVLDFLVQEVLDRLTPADRDFLLRISVADVITPDLARELTGSAAAEERLHRLERTGTFLLEVDPSGRRYRYHGLMAMLLRARLNDEMPDEAHELCRIAARWYSAHGYADDAERHALRAGDVRLVGSVRAARGLDHLLRTGSLVAWAGNAATPGDEPSLKVLSGYEAIRRRDRRAAEAVLAEPAPSTSTTTDGERSVQLLHHVMRMEASRWGCALTTPHEPLPLHTLDQLVDDVPTRQTLHAYATLRNAEAMLNAGSTERARADLLDLTRDSDASEWTRREAAALLALTEVSLGDCTRVTTMARDASLDASTDSALWLSVATAVAHSLHGETAGLRSRADVIAFARDRPRSVLFERCSRLLTSATAIRSQTAAPMVDPVPPGLLTQIALALGVVEGVDREGRLHVFGGPLEATIASARRALAELSVRRMESHLAPWRDADVAHEHPRSIVELDVLIALVEMHEGHEDEALDWIQRAISSAAPSAIWGPLVAHEAALASLLERHSWELGAASPAAVEMLDALRTKFAPPIVMLTDRERAVLHYLPTLMSNQEIAAEMLISVNTVKTHLKAIYRKLGVDRRRDALLRARQVELLSRDAVTRAG
jgi:LuxR family maltose regulon positive regulatory protein